MQEVSVLTPERIAGGQGSSSSLEHMPAGKWTFDESVTKVFADMLARSVPMISGMRSLVVEIACRFVQPGTHIVDLGCSLGDSIAPLIDRFGATNRFVGIEASLPMLEACRARLAPHIESGVLEIQDGDLRMMYPAVPASVTMSVLTVMFTPIEHRFHILEQVFANTVPSGVFIIVEKLLGANGRLDRLWVDLYHAHKQSMGYTREEIDRKRLSLEGVLVPVTAEWNEQLLRSAGFAHVEPFWRALNFCGWVAVKE
jgi:tRNA (cmo5U34)-methyltransferase